MKHTPLTQGKVAVVDDDMYEVFIQRKWHLNSEGYAVGYEGSEFGDKRIRMHRVVVSAPDGMEVDHINGDKLDNRRENLRICTHAQNTLNQGIRNDNKSGFKGVFWDKQSGKYRAQIRANKQTFYLGWFDDAEQAARAYDEKARELHGKFARTNFLN